MKMFKRAMAVVLALCLCLTSNSFANAATKTVTVATQAQLSKAIKAGKATTIKIATKKAVNLTIPANSKTKKMKLEVNAPKAKITNEAQFKSILLGGDKVTYVENGKNNVITVSAKMTSFKVTKKTTVKKVTFKGAKANVQVNTGSRIASVAAAKKNATLNIRVNGTVDKMTALSEGAKIALRGETDRLPVEVAAKGVVLTVEATSEIVLDETAKVVLKDNSEGTVIITKEEADAEVVNKSEHDVVVSTPDGDVTVEAGENKDSIVTPEPETPAPEPSPEPEQPSGGGSTGSGGGNTNPPAENPDPVEEPSLEVKFAYPTELEGTAVKNDENYILSAWGLEVSESDGTYALTVGNDGVKVPENVSTVENYTVPVYVKVDTGDCDYNKLTIEAQRGNGNKVTAGTYTFPLNITGDGTTRDEIILTETGDIWFKQPIGAMEYKDGAWEPKENVKIFVTLSKDTTEVKTLEFTVDFSGLATTNPETPTEPTVVAPKLEENVCFEYPFETPHETGVHNDTVNALKAWGLEATQGEDGTISLSKGNAEVTIPSGATSYTVPIYVKVDGKDCDTLSIYAKRGDGSFNKVGQDYQLPISAKEEHTDTKDDIEQDENGIVWFKQPVGAATINGNTWTAKENITIKVTLSKDGKEVKTLEFTVDFSGLATTSNE